MTTSPTRTFKGLSLIEVSVTMAILSVVIMVVATASAGAFKQLGAAQNRMQDFSGTKNATDAMSRTLRTAVLPSQVGATCQDCDTTAFISGDDTSVTFYANIDNDYDLPASGNTFAGPKKVTYKLENNSLIEQIQQPLEHDVKDYNYQYCDVTVAGCEHISRVLSDNVVANSTAVFTYYNRNSDVLPTPLDGDSLMSVDSVDLNLTVQISKSTGDVSVSTRVALPNADSLIQPTPTPMPS